MTHHESHQTTEDQRKKNDDQTSEMRQKAEATAQQASQKARETASEVGEKAKAQTREMADTAKEEARSMAETRKSQVTSELHNVAQAFRTSSQQLRQQNEEPVARYANQIADRIEDASSYLSGRSVDDLLSDAEDFARRQPELFLGGAFGVGLLVSRFFKSSERQYAGHDDRYSAGAYSQGRGYGQLPGSTQRTTRDWETRHSGAGESSLPRTTTGQGQTRTTTGQTGTTTGQTGTTTGQTGTSTRRSGSTTDRDQSTTRTTGGDGS